MNIARSKKILELRLLKRMTHAQIGELFGISQVRVRDIINKCYRIFCWSLERQERLLKIKNVPLELPKEDFVTLKDFSIRTQNALRSANIEEFEDLAKFRQRDILRLRQIGRTGLTEIKNLMKLRGISFRDDGSFQGGLGRGSGEAHLVSDSKIQNACRGRIDKTGKVFNSCGNKGFPDEE